MDTKPCPVNAELLTDAADDTPLLPLEVRI